MSDSLPANPADQPAEPATAPDPLADAARSVEAHVARDGWDQPARLFALVTTEQLVAHEPHLAASVTPTGTPLPPGHLTAVEQEGLPPTESLDDLLAGIGWPDTVEGAALVVERVVLPPSAEAGIPEDEQAAVAYVSGHADRRDVRMSVAVRRSGARACLLRIRERQGEDAVAEGPDLVPGLADALLDTLRD